MSSTTCRKTTAKRSLAIGLLDDVWGLSYHGGSNVVDVFIAHLRKKIERPELPRLIHTRRGHGYVLGERGDGGGSVGAGEGEP